MLWHLALRELKRSWRFGLFFIFNLSLGLTGFVALEAFKEALETHIKANAKTILSADLAVWSHRELSDAEVKTVHEALPAGTEESKSYEFFAMLNSAKGSRLVLVKAIDKAYPFYGDILLDSGTKITHSSDKEILHQPEAWLYPELQAQMNLQKGDEISLGQLKLKVADFVKTDGTQTFRSATIAPRVFINRELLASSGLIQFGSTFSVAYLLKLPDIADPDKIKNQIYGHLTDPQISIDTPQIAGEDSGRQLRYLSDYLGLVAIVALFMSALGAAYIYRLFLSQRLKEVAILRTLGLQSVQAVGVYVLQASMLGFLAAIPTLLLTHFVLPLLSRLLAALTPFVLEPIITPQAVVICIAMAVLGSFVVSLPFLVKIFDLRPSGLFSEDNAVLSTQSRFRVWPFLPALAMFYFLSVYQAHSWKIGSVFSLSLLGVIAILIVAGYFGVKLVGFLQPKNWVWKFSLRSVSRRQASSLAVFVAMGIGALLINILPQLKDSLQDQFQLESGSQVPGLFMFDIQDEEVPGIQKILQDENLKILGLSPLVRARLLKVNGQNYERQADAQGFKTREEERDARFRNRGLNLSYRTELSPTESIVAGKPMTDTYDPARNKVAELSVEKGYADRMDLHLQDHLVFDVQGIEIEGQIVNFRKVRWTSFQPNFFVLVQNGVLNDAPKTFVAAVPTLPADQKVRLQNALAKSFSNISIIDVTRLVDDLLKTADQMSWSLELMAALALITGYIVLYSIVRSQIRLRRWELNMLKILGASWKEVAGFVLVEFSFLAFFSALLGAFLSLFVSFGISYAIFEGDFHVSLWQPLVSVLVITVLSLVVSFVASLGVVRESSLTILREEK